jgi:hypothetical protein
MKKSLIKQSQQVGMAIAEKAIKNVVNQATELTTKKIRKQRRKQKQNQKKLEQILETPRTAVVRRPHVNVSNRGPSFTMSDRSFVSKGAPKGKSTNRGQRFVHTELISEVTGSSLFTVAQTYYVNAGIVSTFPELSKWAKSYERAIYHRVEFHFMSLVGQNTQLVGETIWVPQYESGDQVPQNKVDASMISGSKMTSSLYNSSIVVLGGGARGALSPTTEYLIRNIQPSSDSNLECPAKVTFATSNFPTPNTTVIGNLLVSYDIELVQSKIPSTLSGDLPLIHGYSIILLQLRWVEFYLK